MIKILPIYVCSLVILVSIVLPLTFPAVALVLYVNEGFSGAFIAVSIITILIEPLAIGLSYALLKSIKDIYNDLLENLK